MSSKVSQLEKLKLDTAYFDELRRKSEKERVRRQAGAKKLKEEHKQKRLQREQQLKLEQQRREEKQRRQAKVSVEVTLSLKKVIDHLTKVKDLVPLDVIFKQLGCKGSKQKLLELLRKSPYAEVKEGTKPLLVKYKSKYDISSKTELEAFMTKLWRQPLGVDVVHGVSYDDVADSYKGCEEDIADLVSKGRFYVVVNPKTQKKQLFYPDSAPLPAKPLDNALLQLWNEDKCEADKLDDLLRAEGIRPATRVFKWRSVARAGKTQKKKVAKKREYRARNLTNVHMPELFQSKQPETFN